MVPTSFPAAVESKRGTKMSLKEAVIEMIRRMPEDATVPDIIAELYVRQKIDQGERQLDAGQGIDHDEVKKRLARWLD
jgi:hypothetical protein